MSLLAQYSSDGLSRNLREMCWGGNNNFVSRAGGGGEETEKTRISDEENRLMSTDI